MKIYMRKIDNQCITHQIGITKEIFNEFFDSNFELSMEGLNSHERKDVKILNSTDLRFDNNLKNILDIENPNNKEGDFLIIYKDKKDKKPYYIVEDVSTENEKYNTISDLYLKDEKHLYLINDNEIFKSKRIYPLNQILYGPPGTGKTYSTAEYAMAIIEGVDINSIRYKYETRTKLMEEYKRKINEKQIRFITFHQNYSYEDFIIGLKPIIDKPMQFNYIDGVFKVISDEASRNENKDKNYVLIIDEINRGNISKIFGELITLIEEDKRKGCINEIETILPSGHKFSVASNLYILGTMNSADRSISLIDSALRRRFKFIEIYPNSLDIKNSVLKEIFENLNSELYDNLKSSDLLIGQSYFLDKNENDILEIMNNHVIPLLYEYFYDNKNKIKDILNKLSLNKYDCEILDSNMHRLRIKKNKGNDSKNA